ncbi:MAG: hypothetical protein ACHQX1_01340 [Candidatus Micrarchaeales archaeon]
MPSQIRVSSLEHKILQQVALLRKQSDSIKRAEVMVEINPNSPANDRATCRAIDELISAGFLTEDSTQSNINITKEGKLASTEFEVDLPRNRFRPGFARIIAGKDYKELTEEQKEEVERMIDARMDDQRAMLPEFLNLEKGHQRHQKF